MAPWTPIHRTVTTKDHLSSQSLVDALVSIVRLLAPLLPGEQFHVGYPSPLGRFRE